MLKNVKRTQEGMDSVIDRTRDAVVDVTDRAEHGVESAAERVAEGAHVAGDYFRDGAETASRGAHRQVRRAAKAIDHGYNRARGGLSRAETAATDYFSEHPVRILLTAAAVGLVLGLCMSWRRQAD